MYSSKRNHLTPPPLLLHLLNYRHSPQNIFIVYVVQSTPQHWNALIINLSPLIAYHNIFPSFIFVPYAFICNIENRNLDRAQSFWEQHIYATLWSWSWFRQAISRRIKHSSPIITGEQFNAIYPKLFFLIWPLTIFWAEKQQKQRWKEWEENFSWKISTQNIYFWIFMYYFFLPLHDWLRYHGASQHSLSCVCLYLYNVVRWTQCCMIRLRTLERLVE